MKGVKFENSKQLRRDIDKGSLNKIYLFLGEEDGEKDKITDILIKKTIPAAEDRRNSVSIFHAENGELVSAAEFCMSQTMFSSRRICVLKNIGEIKLSNEDKNIFLEMIRGLDDSAVLIMTSVDKSPPPFIKSDDLELIKVIQFWRMFDSDISMYVSASLKKANIRLDEGALKKIIFFTGKDIKKIDDSIEILSLSGETGIITEEMIKKYLVDVSGATVFDYIDLLFKRDRASIGALKKIIDDGTPELPTLGLIVKQAEAIEKFHFLIKKGVSRDEAVKLCGIYQKNTDNFFLHTKEFIFERLEKIFPLISAADYMLKSSARSKEIISNPLFVLTSEILLIK